MARDSSIRVNLGLGASLEADHGLCDVQTVSVPPLELDRQDLAKRRVTSVRVVPALDELEHDRHRLGLLAELVHHQ